MANTNPPSNNFDSDVALQMDALRTEILASAERDRDALELNLRLLDYMEHMNEVLTEIIADVKKYKEQLTNLVQERYIKQEPTQPK